MLELYKAECRRFRWWALGVGALHAAVLLFFDRVVDPLHQPLLIYQLTGGVYAAAGALLGVYQTASYARINHWIALLHRPLAPRRIMFAVTGAGATMLTAAILLPLILLLVSHGQIGGRFVDSRHWLLIGAGVLIGLIGFLGGAYAVLSPRRYGWLVLVFALLPTMSAAAGWTALLVQAALAGVLALLVMTRFKPDLQAPPQRAVALAGTALVVALGAHRAMGLIGDFIFQALWIVSGSHPLNSAPPKDGVIEANRADPGDLVIAGLGGRSDRQAALWREQIRMSEVFELPTAQMWLPVRGELTNVAPPEFDDSERGIRWTFSHDTMTYRGVRLADMQAAGQLGVAGGFEAPPLDIGDNRMIAGSSIYAFDPANGRIHRRIRLTGGETVVAAPAPVGDAVAVLGNRALHLLDRRELDDGEPRAAFATVPLPAPVGDLRRLDVVELLDGYLVSFSYGRDSVNGPAASWQRVIAVDGAGKSHTAGYRPLPPDFPAAARFRGYWTSPTLNAIRTFTESVGAPEQAVAEHAPIEVPTSIWVAAALCALIAAAGTAWLARKRRLGLRHGGAWTVAALIFGIPMLIAFWLIRPKPRA